MQFLSDGEKVHVTGDKSTSKPQWPGGYYTSGADQKLDPHPGNQVKLINSSGQVKYIPTHAVEKMDDYKTSHPVSARLGLGGKKSKKSKTSKKSKKSKTSKKTKKTKKSKKSTRKRGKKAGFKIGSYDFGDVRGSMGKFAAKTGMVSDDVFTKDRGMAKAAGDVYNKLDSQGLVLHTPGYEYCDSKYREHGRNVEGCEGHKPRAVWNRYGGKRRRSKRSTKKAGSMFAPSVNSWADYFQKVLKMDPNSKAYDKAFNNKDYHITVHEIAKNYPNYQSWPDKGGSKRRRSTRKTRGGRSTSSSKDFEAHLGRDATIKSGPITDDHKKSVRLTLMAFGSDPSRTKLISQFTTLQNAMNGASDWSQVQAIASQIDPTARFDSEIRF